MSDKTLTVRLQHLGTASLFEAAGKRGAMDPAIKPIGGSGRFAGRAATVETPRGDNLAIHRLLAESRCGDVIVVDARSATDIAVWGEVMTAAARTAGYAALVVDGAVRDGDAVAPEAFPVFARGLAIPGPSKSGDGRSDCIIKCAGVAVNPGDWIVGDVDGVVVLPEAETEAITSQAETRESDERAMIARLEAGETTTLEELGLASAST